MALQTSYQTRMGFTAPSAYVRIKDFVGNKSDIRVTLEVYFDLASRSNYQSPIGMEMAHLAISDGATMQDMYNALKLQPLFINAVDV